MTNKNKTNLKVTSEVKEIQKSYSWMLWAVGIVSFALYANTLAHGFVLDDIAVIQENKFVKNGILGIKDIFTTFYWQGYWNSNSGLYRPMSLVFFAIEWQLMPNSPFIHHFSNVVFYVLNNILLFIILRHFFKNYSYWITFIIVILFAVHPIHTEVVANIKSRDEILCLFFFLLSVYGLFCRKGMYWKISSVIFFLFCLLSKEAGILFLPILAFLLWKESKDRKELLRGILPHVVITVCWLLWHQFVINSSPYKKIQYTYLDNSLVACKDTLTQIATGFTILGRYICNAFFPVNMSYDYSFNQIPCAEFFSFSFLGSVFLILLLLGIAFYFRKKCGAISFGIIFFFMTIALATNILMLIGTTMGDRLLYTPVLGICIAFVFIIFHSFKKMQNDSNSSRLIVGFGLLFLVFFTNSFQRNKDWKSNFTLLTSDINHAPNSARVNFNYATTFFSDLPEDVSEQQSQLPSIIEYYKRVLRIDPNDKSTLMNLGVCYYRIKDYDNAYNYTSKAMQIDPNDGTLFRNIADIYFMKLDYEKAVTYYKKCILSKSDDSNTYNFFGSALFNLKRYSEAITVFEEGLKKQPEHAQMWMNYGNALAMSSRLKEAIKTFEKAYALDPNQKQALNCLFMAYRDIGDYVNANYYYQLYINK
jgi:Flp pilus assembly protein TadD